MEGRQQQVAGLSQSRPRLANVVSVAVEESWISAAASRGGAGVGFFSWFFLMSGSNVESFKGPKPFC